MSLHNVRVPPDSTGKRVLQQALLAIAYGSGTIPFVPGDDIACASSGITGTVVRVDGGTVSGTLYVHLDDTSPTTPTANEAIEVASVANALLVEATPYFVQATSVVSAENGLNGQVINDYGAALMTFTEGQPSLTSDGALRVGNQHTLGRYSFVDDAHTLDFWQDTAGTSSIGHVPAQALTTLQVGSGSGDRARLVTLRYHPYVPAIGNTSLFSLVVGDTGKAGNVREWGYGDAANGLFWTLDGTSLGVTVRSSTSGSAVDDFVPRADWNGDPLDGTGRSRFTLDVTKRNVYWIDFLWLGSGSVRFGVIDATGRRLVAHTMLHVGGGVVPYMATATLPMSVANLNTSGTASTSELKLICMAVAANHQHQYTYDRFADVQGTALLSITTDTPVLSIRPKLTVAGKVNHIQILPDTLSLLVTGGPVRVDLVYGVASLTGASWQVGASSLDYDVTATAMGGYARRSISLIVGAGTHNLDLKPFIDETGSAIGLHPDGVTRPIVSCLLTKLVPADTVTALACLTHREHRT